MTFDSSRDESFLQEHLAGVLGRPVSSADVARWREAYRAYNADFDRYMDDLYVRYQ